MESTHVVYEVVFHGRTGRKRNPSTERAEIARHPTCAPAPSNPSLKPAVDAALKAMGARMARDAQWEVRSRAVRVEVTHCPATNETRTSELRDMFGGSLLLMCGIYD